MIDITIEALGQRMTMSMEEWHEMEKAFKASDVEYRIIVASKVTGRVQ